MKMSHVSSVVLAIVTSSLVTSVFAAENSWDLSYVPRIYLSGFMGPESTALGQGDILMPLFQRTDRVLFLYGQGRVSENNCDLSIFDKTPYVLSPGIGYRQMVAESVLLGAYVFADYNTSTSGEHFWGVSPGVEALGKVWDARANGYFPINKKSWTTKGWADDFGVYDYVRFSNNEQYDRLASYHLTEEVSPGGDLEVGRKLFKFNGVLVKAYLGGYYFDMKDKTDITGGSARITVQPTSYLTFFADDTYDNVFHNTFMFGARIKLNDLFSHDRSVREDQDLSVRLFDQVQRNLGTLSLANMVPSSKGDLKLYDEKLERDHVWFFDGNKTVDGKGNYEDPYSYLQYQQNTINSIHNVNSNYAYLYLNPGNYHGSSAIKLNDISSESISLYQNQSLWGRTKSYQKPATGDVRPLITGQLRLASDTSLNDLILQNDVARTFNDGVIINDAANVNLNDVKIGNADNGAGAYHIGINMVNTNLTLNNSEVYGYSNEQIPLLKKTNNSTLDDDGIGIKTSGASTITANNNSIVQGKSENSEGMGIYVAPNSDGNITMGDINGDGTSEFIGKGASGYGLYADNYNGNVIIGNITGSNFTGIGSGSNSDFGYGLYAGTAGQNASKELEVTIGNINQSNFTGTGTGSGINGTISRGYGFYADITAASDTSSNLAIGNITGSNFTGTAIAADAPQIRSEGNGMYVNVFSYENNDASIGDITDSNFAGTGKIDNVSSFANSENFGMYVFAGSEHSEHSNTNVKMGNITGSNFIGTGNVTGLILVPLYVDNTSLGNGLYVYATGENSALVMGNITRSSFTGIGSIDGLGTGSDSIGFGMWVSSVGKNYINDVTIGNITDSDFTGTGTVTGSANSGVLGYGMFVFSSAGVINNLVIGNITGSSFIGTGTVAGAPDDSGAVGYGIFVNSNAGTNNKVTIGNIIGSSFNGSASSDGPGDAEGQGFHYQASSGRWTSTTIGNITDSNFIGIGIANGSSDNYSLGIGMYIASVVNQGANNMVIGSISRTSFTGIGINEGFGYSHGYGFLGQSGDLTIGNITESVFTGVGKNDSNSISLFGNTVAVGVDEHGNPKTYTNGSDLRKDLEKSNSLPNQVCVNNNCSL